MSSIISNRRFLVKNPTEIIQEINITDPQPQISSFINKPVINENKNIKKKQKYFIEEFYI